MLSEQSIKDIEKVASTLIGILDREVEKLKTADDATALAGMVMGVLQVKFAEAMTKEDGT